MLAPPNPEPRAGASPLWAGEWFRRRRREEPPEAAQEPRTPVEEAWRVLVVEAIETAQGHAQGEFIARLEKRWSNLGKQLKKSWWAQWFRAWHLRPADRRSWTSAPLWWWPGDTRDRPNPSPWFDWPLDRRGAVWWDPEAACLVPRTRPVDRPAQ